MEKKGTLWKKRIIRRQGNLEIRNSISSHHDFEIIKWFPNSLYRKEAFYTYDEKHGYYIPKTGWCTAIDPSCFKDPENCLVLGWIDKDEWGNVKVNLTLGKSKKDSEAEKELEDLIRFFLNNKEKFYRALRSI
jgi:hypothetical protein